VEFDHTDPLFQRSVAVTGVIAYRGKRIKQLRNKLLFGDNHGGEIFYVAAIRLPEGGQDAIRRVVFEDKGSTKTLLQLVQERMFARQDARNAGRYALQSWRRKTTSM
jgi:hypothetical protein